MSLKIGDKVDILDVNKYGGYHGHVPVRYWRHGSIRMSKDRSKVRGAKIVNTYEDYFIVRYLDQYNNYVDLPYREEYLNKIEDCEPNVIPVSSFGVCLLLEFGLTKECLEIRFDNFNPEFYVGKLNKVIYLFKIRGKRFTNKSISDIYILPNDGTSVRKLRKNSTKYQYIIKNKIKLNHRPLILKKVPKPVRRWFSGLLVESDS